MVTLCHVTVSTAVPPAARSDGAGRYCTISGGVASSSQEARGVLAGARLTYDPAGLKAAASDGLFHFLFTVSLGSFCAAAAGLSNVHLTGSYMCAWET